MPLKRKIKDTDIVYSAAGKGLIRWALEPILDSEDKGVGDPFPARVVYSDVPTISKELQQYLESRGFAAPEEACTVIRQSCRSTDATGTDGRWEAPNGIQRTWQHSGESADRDDSEAEKGDGWLDWLAGDDSTGILDVR